MRRELCEAGVKSLHQNESEIRIVYQVALDLLNAAQVLQMEQETLFNFLQKYFVLHSEQKPQKNLDGDMPAISLAVVG